MTRQDGERIQLERFLAVTAGGHLAGWVLGTGPRVLLLHGGPGLSFGYLDGLAAEIGDGYQVAAYQQRGLAPSTTEGPFDVERAIADLVDVLDHLEWDRAVLVGHSWGGHLVFHATVAIPERLFGGLAVDPLGAVGDGGAAAGGAALFARTPAADRARAQELDQRASSGNGTDEDAMESLRLVWPAYFADPAAAPEMPPMQLSLAASRGIWESIMVKLPTLEAMLATVAVPTGVLLGASSPFPPDSAAATARTIPGAWLDIVDDAGHLPWIDRPGCVRSALRRLVEPADST